jgi:uncharacterized protein (TIGR03032 family)
MSAQADEAPLREVRYEHTLNLVPLLTQLQASLLVSTYQAGKVVVVGVADGKLSLAYPNFERAMGLAVRPDCLAVGTQTHVWILRSSPGLAPRLEPAGQYDGCYLTRSALYTGPIHGHEQAWIGEELWIVNTLFSCLCVPHERYSFVPRWRPPFISAFAAEDRCHLNGLAVAEGMVRYVTAMAETDTVQGWRPVKATAGCLIDVASGATVARGFAMPHSPRLHQGRLWLLDSGTGRMVVVDPASGKVETVAALPGYTRGLAFHGSLAFIGLSRIRETSTFGGVPIAEKREQLRCGVAVVDLTSGRSVAYLEFKSGVEEIFDVQVLPGWRCPLLSGPFAVAEGTPPIWVLPAARAPLGGS